MKYSCSPHQRELSKASNTGAIAIQHVPHIVERIVWRRIYPDIRLTSLIEHNRALLLYQRKDASDSKHGSPNSDIAITEGAITPPDNPSSEKTKSDNCVSAKRVTDKATTDYTGTAAINAFENIIIIDSTWQESQKIYNRSEYLKKAPVATITTATGSQYRLRRNQVDGGLCTIECIIEVLSIKGKSELASKLALEFKKFNQR